MAARALSRGEVKADAPDVVEQLRAGRLADCRLEGGSISGERMRSTTLIDVVARGVDCTTVDWLGGRLKRVRFEGCRMTGVGAVDMEIEDVVFRDCKLDLALFRSSRLNRVVFEDCVLDDADFAGAWIKDTSFPGSDLPVLDLDGVRLTRADFRGCRLDVVRGDVTALRGAIIEPLQLVELAPLLADGLGITVEER
jgi:fluoroquinolone resistance protein